MPQPRHEPVPDEEGNVPKVRLQGALFNCTPPVVLRTPYQRATSPFFMLVSNTGGILIAHLHGAIGGLTPGPHLIVTSRGGLTMSTLRSWSVIVLLACLGAVALHAAPATADPLTVAQGATYLLTITDATTGVFASRGALTLHGDHTLSAIDSGQGGPTFLFSSQLGAW